MSKDLSDFLIGVHGALTYTGQGPGKLQELAKILKDNNISTVEELKERLEK